jgi:signal peptidase II
LVLAADQASKSLVVATAPGGGGGGLVSVRLVRNTGASFGIGAGHPVLVTLVAAAVLAVAAVLLARARSRSVALFLAAVLGGAAGNLADRLLRSPDFGRGGVVDWIHLAGYPAAFNVADVAIRLGAAGALAAALGTWSLVGGRRIRARALLRSGPRAVEDPEKPGRQAGR